MIRSSILCEFVYKNLSFLLKICYYQLGSKKHCIHTYQLTYLLFITYKSLIYRGLSLWQERQTIEVRLM